MDEQMDEEIGGQMDGRGREDRWMRCNSRCLMGDWLDGWIYGKMDN